MIRNVTFERTTWADLPNKFEAGTPAIVEAIGLGAALSFMRRIGMTEIGDHEATVTGYALGRLRELEFVRIVGRPRHRGGVISFLCEGAHPHDLATLLDQQGIAIRAGQHCAEPLIHRLGLTATARASFAVYTTCEEIDALVHGLKRAHAILA